MEKEAINHPNHYNKGGMEVAVAMDLLNFPSQWLGHALKYACRSPHKGKELEDLKKAVWCTRRACSYNAYRWDQWLEAPRLKTIASALLLGIPEDRPWTRSFIETLLLAGTNSDPDKAKALLMAACDDLERDMGAPAPINLKVPPHMYVADSTIIIGEDKKGA